MILNDQRKSTYYDMHAWKTDDCDCLQQNSFNAFCHAMVYHKDKERINFQNWIFRIVEIVEIV